MTSSWIANSLWNIVPVFFSSLFYCHLAIPIVKSIREKCKFIWIDLVSYWNVSQTKQFAMHWYLWIGNHFLFMCQMQSLQFAAPFEVTRKQNEHLWKCEMKNYESFWRWRKRFKKLKVVSIAQRCTNIDNETKNHCFCWSWLCHYHTHISMCVSDAISLGNICR